MRAFVLGAVTAAVLVCAIVATRLVIMANLPAGETAGTIALSWLPVLLVVARHSQRRVHPKIGSAG